MVKSKILITKQDALKFYKSKFYGDKYVGLHKGWFPLKSSPMLSGIVSDLMGDGHLQEGLWRIDYCSKKKSELRRFERGVFMSFGIHGKIRKCSTNRFGETYLMGINNKLFSRILNKIGVPGGSKADKSYIVPCWIIEDKECFRSFLRRYFTCEGTVSIEGKNSFAEISMAKDVKNLENGIYFLNQIKRGMSAHFGIESMRPFTSGFNLRKNGSKSYNIKLRIKKSRDLKIFHKKVGFEDKQKQHKLKKALKLKGQPSTGQ